MDYLQPTDDDNSYGLYVRHVPQAKSGKSRLAFTAIMNTWTKTIHDQWLILELAVTLGWVLSYKGSILAF